MKTIKTHAIVSLLFLSSLLTAQGYQIGHTTLIFFDSSRNRNIETELYYPAESVGEDVPVATGSFPVIVFGHGFLMDWESYQNFWDELVPGGYVLCFPTTEMGLSPNHANFGLDMKFVAVKMQNENGDNNSLFYQSLSSKTALMGHSMGGAAAFLAAENDTSLATLVSFAAAETTPSAIAAATNISCPALVFAGEEDCVTPPIENQLPMYEALSAHCKTYISIVKGIHCYFADYNFNCTLGESFCNPNPDITRPQQQSVTFDFLNLWLDFALKENPTALDIFNDSLQNSNRISFLQKCNTTDLPEMNSGKPLEIFPNPATDRLQLVLPGTDQDGIVFIYNLSGGLVFQTNVDLTAAQLDISQLPVGDYVIRYTSHSGTSIARFVKNAKTPRSPF